MVVAGLGDFYWGPGPCLVCRPIHAAGFGWDAPRPQAFHNGISAGPCGGTSHTWQVWGYAYGIYSGDGFLDLSYIWQTRVFLAWGVVWEGGQMGCAMLAKAAVIPSVYAHGAYGTEDRCGINIGILDFLCSMIGCFFLLKTRAHACMLVLDIYICYIEIIMSFHIQNIRKRISGKEQHLLQGPRRVTSSTYRAARMRARTISIQTAGSGRMFHSGMIRVKL